MDKLTKDKNRKSILAILGWVWLVAVIVVLGAAIIGNVFSADFVFWLSLVTPIIIAVLLLFSAVSMIGYWLGRKW